MSHSLINVFKVCSGYLQSMFRVCSEYGPCMFIVCSEYVRSIVQSRLVCFANIVKFSANHETEVAAKMGSLTLYKVLKSMPLACFLPLASSGAL